MKTIWNLVKNECGNLNPISEKQSLELSPENLNSFFIQKVSDIVEGMKVPNSGQFNYFINRMDKPKCSFHFRLVTVEEVFRVISKMNNSKCEDVYGLSPVMLKAVSQYISEPLTHIINTCILDNTYPSKFKFSKIIPVHKNGSKELCDNYRPISIVPTISKILETVLNEQIMNYMEMNNLLSDSQFGYRIGHSTVKAVISYITNNIEALENKYKTQSRFFDLSKAFDTVAHQILLEKLKAYGFTENAIALLKSYLSNRYQRVDFNATSSKFKLVSHGVPQGSNLGPTLFIIYINDLPFNIIGTSIEKYLYADDLALCSNSTNAQELQNNLDTATDEVEAWCSANLLCLNRDKTQNINISFSRISPLQNNTDTVNFLGITIDSRLNWKAHIDKIASKVNKGIFAIRRLRDCVNIDVLKQVYFAMIHSHLSYGSILWANSPDSIRLFILQKRAIRLICGLPFRSHCKMSFKQLKIMTLPALFVFQCLMYVKENASSFTIQSEVHNYNTKSSNNIVTFQCNYAKTQKSFYYIAVKMYNVLPFAIRQLPHKLFKNIIKKRLIEAVLYSTEEYFDVCNSFFV